MISIRGAITTENTEKGILGDTTLLLREIIDRNGVSISDIISVQFTATRDLYAVYPAKAAREMGITDAGLMCFQEMKVEGSLDKCVRVNMFVDNRSGQSGVSHVYLKGAEILRRDLTKQEKEHI